MPSAKLSSAEWIIEAPWSGGVLPLADFLTTQFGNDYTGVANTCFATVGGNAAASIGSLNQNNVSQITMVDKSGNNKATPSGVSTDGTSFTDVWWSAGP
jgi:hypothetical protein